MLMTIRNFQIQYSVASIYIAIPTYSYDFHSYSKKNSDKFNSMYIDARFIRLGRYK